jgi:hypothetical protein
MSAASRFLIGDGNDMHTRRGEGFREHSVDADTHPHARTFQGIARRASNPVGGLVVPTRSLIAALPVSVLVDHGGEPIGEVTFVRVTAEEIIVRGFVFPHEDLAWHRIASGKLRCLSMCALMGPRGALLLEVSVCAKGDDPDARITHLCGQEVG